MSALATAIHSQDRELRLRRRIDSLAARCAAKERRILELEDALRLYALPQSERDFVLERRVKHMNRRLIKMSEALREARRVA